MTLILILLVILIVLQWVVIFLYRDSSKLAEEIFALKDIRLAFYEETNSSKDELIALLKKQIDDCERLVKVDD